MAVDPDFTEIHTDRLVIRRFRPEDVEAFAAYRSDPDVARYQSWEAFTRAQAETLVAEMMPLHPGTPGEWFQFAVDVNDRLVGDTGLCVDEDDPSRVKLGFSFAPAHQGNGYATEAARGMIDYAVERLGVAVVVGISDARNARSIALLERLGMTYVSSERVWTKGEWCTDRTYELWRGIG